MLRRLSIVCLLVTVSLPLVAQEPDAVLGEIVVSGNTSTDRAVIDRVIGMKPGEPFPLEAFDQVWDRLEDCGYFAFVDLDTEEDDDGRVTLYVTVEEEKTFRATPYVRYDRRHKYLLGAALKEINLRGQGEVLEVQAIAYRIQRGQVAWTKPWLFGRDGLSLKIDGLWEQGGFVWRPFDYSRWDARLGLTQDIGSGFAVSVVGGYASFEQKDDYRWRYDDLVVDFAAGTRDVMEFHIEAAYDTRDNPYYPKHGMHHTARWQLRDGDEIDGQSGFRADLSIFQEVLGKPIIALRAYGEMLDEVGAEEYVLRWGGPQTVRGAPYARREGDTAYLLSAEVRWPLVLMPVSQAGETVGAGLHGFVDAGDAWYEDEHPILGPSAAGSRRGLLSFGAGAHLNLLTWQLRFEAAKERDGDWTFEFMDVFNF